MFYENLKSEKKSHENSFSKGKAKEDIIFLIKYFFLIFFECKTKTMNDLNFYEKKNKVIVKKYYCLALFILTLYISPFLIFAEDSYILIKDTLDFSLPNFKTLAESGKIFADSNTVMNEMMSANRGSFESEFNFVLWLFYFLNLLQLIQ